MPATGIQTKSLGAGQRNISLDGVTYGVAAGDIGHAFAVVHGPNQHLRDKYSWDVAITGTPDAVVIVLQGSLDQTNWVTIDTLSTVQTYTIRSVADTPMRYLRVKATTITNGTSPTVTSGITI